MFLMVNIHSESSLANKMGGQVFSFGQTLGLTNFLECLLLKM